MERTAKEIGQLMASGFPEVDTGNVADAGHDVMKIMDAGIKPVHHSMKVAGPVFTIDQPGGTNFPILQAISKAPAGSVLVINAEGWMKTGHIGSLIALACEVRGIAGIVIDGAVRDVPDLIKMGFPVFARGSVPKGNAPHKGVLNQPIQCGGVSVTMQDMIFADATGVVVFPQERAQDIYDKAAYIATREIAFTQALNEGKDLLEIPDFLEFHNIDVNKYQ